jgi:hypothetical protein
VLKFGASWMGRGKRWRNQLPWPEAVIARVQSRNCVSNWISHKKQTPAFAEYETHPGVRTVLMGMGYGWLAFAESVIAGEAAPPR